MQSEETIKQTAYNYGKEAAGVKFSNFIFAAFVLMAVAIIYVWSHTHMTELEYRIAGEISTREKLLDEQRKLKVEQATLKSPQRIEAIATSKLGMSYPESDQVIVLK
jgi:cell division protein FtsL